MLHQTLKKYQNLVTLVIDYFGLFDVYLGDAFSLFLARCIKSALILILTPDPVIQTYLTTLIIHY